LAQSGPAKRDCKVADLRRWVDRDGLSTSGHFVAYLFVSQPELCHKLVGVDNV